MSLEQTVTIVNNSGKIISTGKQLASIFKEAKASYHEKKADLKSSRSGLRRAQTFDQSRSLNRSHSRDRHCPPSRSRQDDSFNDGYEHHRPRHQRHHSHQSKAELSQSRSRRHHDSSRRPALTEDNLETLTRLSDSSAPRSTAQPSSYRDMFSDPLPEDSMSYGMSRAPHHSFYPTSHGVDDNIDMHLAYGNIPPDLASRQDLDPKVKERTARQLISKIEVLLDEAHCLQHSASTTIRQLQKKPDAAAAVALTLAELSKALAKTSPAILGLLKGKSPAVFALLASPQFLIGTSIAIGLTVVLFGGWKIVKKINKGPQALNAAPTVGPGPTPLRRSQGSYGVGFDEAMVIEEDLSMIESWRRGIEPFGDNESADVELITPTAHRAAQKDHHRSSGDDDKSRRSSRSHRSGNESHRSHRRSSRERHKSKSDRKDEDRGSSHSSKERSMELVHRPKARRSESLFKSMVLSGAKKDRER